MNVRRYFVIVGLFFLTAWSPALRAASPSSRCYSTYGGERTSFPASVATVFNQMPEPVFDQDRKIKGLKWGTVAEGVTVEDVKLGIYRGREIHVFKYYRDQVINSGSIQEQNVTDELVCAVFGFVTETEGDAGTRLRPFFFVDGVGVSSVESFFTSTASQPFALVVREYFEGTGHFEIDSAFAFTSTGARILEVRSSGKTSGASTVRNVEITTYRYSKSGKVTTTRRAFKER